MAPELPGDPSDASPPGRPLADWRRRPQDQRIDRVPLQLRERLATTAELVAHIFELGARIRASMAARGGPWSPITAREPTGTG